MSPIAEETASAGREKMISLRDRFIRHRVPISGSIELTHRCNLRCVHCYLAGGCPDEGRRELSTERWLSVIDEITEAGCLHLLITGGEPLLRSDFAEVYRKAKTSGLLVTVFTNGTTVTGPIIELFADLPPQAVEISLYGSTADTYEAVTGVAGSFRRCLEGIGALRDAGVRIVLKTVLLTGNLHEVEEIRAMARDWDAPFRVDPALFPRQNGDRESLAHRVSPIEAIKMEFDDSARLEDWRRFFGRMRHLPGNDRLYSCGAGQTSFHVDPSGRLLPCLMVKEPFYDLADGTFREGWSDVIPRLRQIEAGPGYRCGACEKRFLCGACPGFFELEEGSPRKPSDYLCQLGEERFRAIVSKDANDLAANETTGR